MATSYRNHGGTGLRIGEFDVTKGGTALVNGIVESLVNGDFRQAATTSAFRGTTGSCTFTNSSTDNVITFDWLSGSSIVIDGFTWYQDLTTSHGTWVLEGSDDLSGWTQIDSSFTLGGAQVSTYTFSNTTGYRAYRLRQTAGSASNACWLQQIEFKLEDIGSGRPSFGNIGGNGPRLGLIAVTTDATTGVGGGTVQSLIDGQWSGNNAKAWFWTASQTGKFLRFDFGSGVSKVVRRIRWRQDSTGTHTTWKVQGSNDASSWTDVGSSFTLGDLCQIIDLANTSTGFRYWQIIHTSGVGTSATPWLTEVEFQLYDSATYTEPRWDNPLGFGDRIGEFDITHSGSAGLSAGAITALVDDDNNVNCSFGNNSTANVITLDYYAGARVLADGFVWTQSGTTGHGTWVLEGSDDMSGWTQIGSSFTLAGTTSRTVYTFANTTYYRGYRLRQTAGNASFAVTLRQLEFRIADKYRSRPSFTRSGGKGHRGGYVTATTTATLTNGQINSSINGAHFESANGDSWAWTGGQSTRVVTWDFVTKKIVRKIRWKQSTTATHGTWQVKGSDDNSSYSNVGSSFTLGGVTKQIIDLSNTTVAYRYWRIEQTAGTTSNTPFLQETEFILAAPILNGYKSTQYTVLSEGAPEPVAVPKTTQYSVLAPNEVAFAYKTTQYSALEPPPPIQAFKSTQYSALAPPPDICTENALVDLVFSEEVLPTYFDPVPANLQLDSETFGTAIDGRFAFFSESTPGTFSITGGVGQSEHAGGPNSNLNDIVVRDDADDYTVPNAWVSVQIVATPTTSAGYDNGGVGLVLDEDNFIFASMDRVAGVARIQITIGGSNTFFSTTAQTWSTGGGLPWEIALSLCNNSATFWRKVTGVWTRICDASVSGSYDFLAAGALTGWKPGFTHATRDNSTWQFDNLMWGHFGGVGMRDHTVVTEHTGRVYVEDDQFIYFTATTADHNGASYLGVYKMDMSDRSFEQTGIIYHSRDSKVYNDHGAGHIIAYPNGTRKLTTATWGNGFGGDIRVVHGETATDILNGVHVMPTMDYLDLPGLLNGSYGSYDSMLVFDDINDRWLIAYSIVTTTTFAGSPFYAALAYSTDDLVTWTLIDADDGNDGFEGTKLVRVNDEFFVVAGGPAGASDSSRVYDDTLTFLGSLDIVFEGGTATQPHPMVFAFDDLFWCLTFDDTMPSGGASFSWGQPQMFYADRCVVANTLVYKSAQYAVLRHSDGIVYKTAQYSVLQSPPIEIYKVAEYAVLGLPPVQASKATMYAALMAPEEVFVFKTASYAVIEPHFVKTYRSAMYSVLDHGYLTTPKTTMYGVLGTPPVTVPKVTAYSALVLLSFPASIYKAAQYSVMAAPTPQYVLYALENAFEGFSDGVVVSAVPTERDAGGIILFLSFDSGTQFKIMRWHPYDGIMWETLVDALPTDLTVRPNANRYIFFIDSAGDVQQLDVETGTLTTRDVGSIPAQVGSQFFDSETGNITYWTGTHLAQVFADRVVVGSESVASAFLDLGRRAGLTPAQLNISGISDVVFLGFRSGPLFTARPIIEQFMEAFGLTVYEDDKIVFLKKAVSSEVTVDADDLMEPFGYEDIFDAYDTQTSTVKYYSDQLDGDENTQRFSLPDDVNQGKTAIDRQFTLLADDDFMRSLAELLVFTYQEKDAEANIALSWKYLLMTPTDMALLTQGFRTNALEIGADLTLRLKLSLDAASKYENFIDITGTSGFGGVQASVAISEMPGPIAFTHRAIGANEKFSADTIYGVTNVTGEFEDEERVSLTLESEPKLVTAPGAQVVDATLPVSWGYLVTPPSVPTNVFTTQQNDSLTIKFVENSGLLQQIYDLNGIPLELLYASHTMNAMVVGNEIIQFRDFEIDGVDPTLVTFSCLLRARWSTDRYISHTAGEVCYIIDYENMDVQRRDIQESTLPIKTLVTRGRQQRHYDLVPPTHLFAPMSAVSITRWDRAVASGFESGDFPANPHVFIQANLRYGNCRDLNQVMQEDSFVENDYQVYLLRDYYDETQFFAALEDFELGDFSYIMALIEPQVEDMGAAAFDIPVEHSYYGVLWTTSLQDIPGWEAATEPLTAVIVANNLTADAFTTTKFSSTNTNTDIFTISWATWTPGDYLKRRWRGTL